MAVFISMLRAVNVVGKNIIPMERLRALYTGLDFQDPKSLIQSGNVVFEAPRARDSDLADRIEAAIEEQFGFRPHVILRNVDEFRSVVARNPFARRTDVPGDKLLVTFLKSDPGETARAAVRAIPAAPEELIIDGSEIFTFYTEGMGRSKLSAAKVERACAVPGTARNWNTVLKLLAIAEARE